MKVAIISDIHGNAVALSAVLKEACSVGVEKLCVLGDLVGYYYQPAVVLELLSNWPLLLIQGNHEAMLKRAMIDMEYKHWVTQNYGHGIDIATKELSPEGLCMLINAPSVKRAVLDDRTFLLCHGAPWDRDAYVYPDAEGSILDRCVQQNVDFVLMGHTHYPFIASLKGTLILNVGSVGQARDVGGYASWAIVDTANRTAVLHKTQYDVHSIEAEAKRVDPDKPFLWDVLRRNRCQ